MVDRKYDKVVQVDIGFNSLAAGNFVTITNVVYFADRVMSPDGDLVEQLSMINSWNPAGVHQNHKYLTDVYDHYSIFYLQVKGNDSYRQSRF